MNTSRRTCQKIEFKTRRGIQKWRIVKFEFRAIISHSHAIKMALLTTVSALVALYSTSGELYCSYATNTLLLAFSPSLSRRRHVDCYVFLCINKYNSAKYIFSCSYRHSNIRSSMISYKH